MKTVEQHWNEILDMTQHPGWHNLMLDTKDYLESLTKGCVLEVVDERGLYERKGRVSVLQQLASMEEIAKQMLKQVEEQREADKAGDTA